MSEFHDGDGNSGQTGLIENILNDLSDHLDYPEHIWDYFYGDNPRYEIAKIKGLDHRIDQLIQTALIYDVLGSMTQVPVPLAQQRLNRMAEVGLEDWKRDAILAHPYVGDIARELGW